MWNLMDTKQIKWDYVIIGNYKNEKLFHYCLLAKLSNECKKKKKKKKKKKTLQKINVTSSHTKLLIE